MLFLWLYEENLIDYEVEIMMQNIPNYLLVTSYSYDCVDAIVLFVMLSESLEMLILMFSY